jgi:predicted nucleic acid-binding protein
MTDEKKRKKYEDKERERQRFVKERDEKRKMYAALADKTDAEVEKLIK